MGEIKSYKDLLIWQKGFQIVIAVYKLVKSFPQEELYALTSQIKRASVSVPSNIAEGYGRNKEKSFNHLIILWTSQEVLYINLKPNYCFQKNWNS